MVATYRLRSDEITDTFLKTIQDNYQNKEIEITIRPIDSLPIETDLMGADAPGVIQEVEDETEYLLKSEANRKLLLAGVEAVKQGRVSHTMTLEEIEVMA